MNTPQKRRLIDGVSGATGIVYAARALEILRSLDVETHLVVSAAADLTRSYESALSRKELNGLGAPLSSGSFQTTGMLIAPCSMRSLA